MRWRFNLGPVGAALRECINNGDESLDACRKTLAALDRCYSTIKSFVSDNDWEEINLEYQTVKNHINTLNIDDEITRIDRLLDENFDGFNPALDCVNDDLRIFYDLCDDYRIWVGI